MAHSRAASSRLGLAEDGVGLGHPHESVPQEVLDTVAAYEQAIIDGTITVPADEEELAAFEPVALDAVATPTAYASSVDGSRVIG